MMKAAGFDQHGPPDVLRLVAAPAPEPAPHQIRVRVVTAGVQPFDTLIRAGAPGMSTALPAGIGNEFAGVVDCVGETVTHLRPGDEVIGWAHMAAHAEYVVTGTEAVVAKPSGLPSTEAGAIGASGQTALSVLRELEIAPGQTLLVAGAAGGAGSMLVQLARLREAQRDRHSESGRHDHLRCPRGHPSGTMEMAGCLGPWPPRPTESMRRWTRSAAHPSGSDRTGRGPQPDRGPRRSPIRLLRWACAASARSVLHSSCSCSPTSPGRADCGSRSPGALSLRADSSRRTATSNPDTATAKSSSTSGPRLPPRRAQVGRDGRPLMGGGLLAVWASAWSTAPPTSSAGWPHATSAR